jgi:hypothetical protein
MLIKEEAVSLRLFPYFDFTGNKPPHRESCKNLKVDLVVLF